MAYDNTPIEVDCTACDELREHAPDFVQYGMTEKICASLKNDTGLNPDASDVHDDCEDLNMANECLIGRLDDEVESYDTCDWKKFMHKFLPNLHQLLRAFICVICGLWTNVHALWAEIKKIWAEIDDIWDAINDIKSEITRIWNSITSLGNRITTNENAISSIKTQIANIISKLTVSSYLGILTLYTNTRVEGSGSGNQAPAFNTNVRQGNLPSSVLQVASDYKGIVVKNTTSVPLLIETTFNSSIYTDQHICCCFIVITRDGKAVGQTPFITPTTYDQQVEAEAFILQPGSSTTMRYYFRIGDANSYFLSQFGKSDSVGDCRCRLDPNNSSNPENQGSYFVVRASSVVDQ